MSHIKIIKILLSRSRILFNDYDRIFEFTNIPFSKNMYAITSKTIVFSDGRKLPPSTKIMLLCIIRNMSNRVYKAYLYGGDRYVGVPHLRFNIDHKDIYYL